MTGQTGEKSRDAVSGSSRPPAVKSNWRWLVPHLPALMILFVVWSVFYARGLDFGYPFIHCGDEHVTIKNAMNIVKTGDFNTNGAGYPPLQTYILSGLIGGKYISNNSNGVYRDEKAGPDAKPIYKPLDKLTRRDIFAFHLLGRFFSAICAFATAVMVYVLCRTFTPSWIATIAALSLLLFPSHVEQGHYLLPNTFNGLLAISAVYTAVRYVRGDAIGLLYASVALSALAISNKMNVTVAAAPIAAFLLRFTPAQTIHIVFLPICGLAVLCATFPYAFLDPGTFVQQYSQTLWSYNFEDAWVRVEDPYFAWSAWLFNQSPVWFCAALLGGMVLLATRTKAAIVFLLPACLYFYARCGLTYYFPHRDLIPLLPFLAVGFGFALHAAFIVPKRAITKKNISQKSVAAGIAAAMIVCVIAFYPLLTNSIEVVKQFVTQDPLQVAQEWVEQNISKDAPIYSENYLSTVPAPDDGFDVRWDEEARPQFYFEDPYCTYGDVEYVVAACSGAYDTMPWLRDMRSSRLINSTKPEERQLLDAYLGANRTLFDTRMTLAYTAASPQYRKVAEWGITWPQVNIYKIPDMLITDFSPSDLWQSISPPPSTQLASNATTSGFVVPDGAEIKLPIIMPEGANDLFVLATGAYAKGQEPPTVTIALGDGQPTVLPTIFYSQKYYTALASSSPRPVHTYLKANTARYATNAGQATIAGFRFARVIDTAKGTPAKAVEHDDGPLGPNLLDGASFETDAPLAPSWTAGHDALLALAKDTETKIDGNNALRADVPAPLNFGISHRPVTVIPGHTYVLKGYIKVRGVEGNAGLEAQDAVGGWTSFIASTNTLTGTTPWHWVHKRFVVPENVTSLRIYLRRPNTESAAASTGTIWYDAVGLHEVQT